MDWKVFDAKNGEKTLQLNSIQIYSKYRPIESASDFILSEYDKAADSYLLIGLGLGYHLKTLINLGSSKKIIVYYFSIDELELFKRYNCYNNWWKKDNVFLVNNMKDIDLEGNIQVLLPNAWLKAIGQDHPLFTNLEVIKRNQISFKKNSSLLLENFLLNSTLNDLSIKNEKQSKIACLVAAGPSLNKTIHWLRNIESTVDIYAVGAALKTLLKYDINPNAVIHSDPSDLTLRQFQDIEYNGILYYLSTANHYSIINHKGPRYILYQQGYDLAEREARVKNCPLVETGSSVGTTTFSLLEQLGYKKIILFGQDLGFYGENTHVNFSTSNRKVMNNYFLREEIANDGSIIQTNAMFQSFKFWYDLKMTNTNVKVYNTAKKGAKIKNVPLINEQQFYELLNGDMI